MRYNVKMVFSLQRSLQLGVEQMKAFQRKNPLKLRHGRPTTSREKMDITALEFDFVV